MCSTSRISIDAVIEETKIIMAEIRGKAFVLIDSEINLDQEFKNKIIESIERNRLQVHEHNNLDTFRDFLAEMVSSDKVLPNGSTYDLISVIVIARKFIGEREFRIYSINDLYSTFVNSPLTANKKVLFAIIMQDCYGMYDADAELESTRQNDKTICTFEAKCPVNETEDHFKIVLNQFVQCLSNANNNENFVNSLEKIKNDNVECEINLLNPLHVPLYLGQ